MIKQMVLFGLSVASRSTNKINNMKFTIALAALHGLVNIFGFEQTFLILRKVGKQHGGKPVVPGMRKRSGSVNRETQVSNVQPELARDLRTTPPRSSIKETTSETRQGY